MTEDDARIASCQMHEQALADLRKELEKTRGQRDDAIRDRDRYGERLKLMEQRVEAAIKCLRP